MSVANADCRARSFLEIDCTASELANESAGKRALYRLHMLLSRRAAEAGHVSHSALRCADFLPRQGGEFPPMPRALKNLCLQGTRRLSGTQHGGRRASNRGT